MPKAKAQDAIARQWEILNLIPRRQPGKTANIIMSSLEALGLAVSKRTIERDLNELSAIFGIVCDDDSKPYKWRWLNGKGADLPSITLTDALSLKIAENILRPLLPNAIIDSLDSRFNEATSKLASIPKHKNLRWLDKVRNVQPALSLIPPAIDEHALEQVQTALLQDKKVIVEYQSFGRKDTRSMTLSPLSLVQRGPTTYLVATANDHDDIRLYTIHRIHNADILDEAVIIPHGFHIDEYIAKGSLNFGSCELIKIEAYVSDWLCKILNETPLSNDQKIDRNGDKNKLTASIENTWQLKWWLLSQGNGIEVIKPQKLRKKIKEELSNALNQYN